MKSPVYKNGYKKEELVTVSMQPLSRSHKKILSELFNDERLPTATSEHQIRSERTTLRHFEKIDQKRNGKNILTLQRKKHIQYLNKSLESFASEEKWGKIGNTWTLYWILNGLYVLDSMPNDNIQSLIVEFLAKCQHQDGGFGGFPGQSAHLPSTFAAVNALCIIGTNAAYDTIDRSRLQMFLWRMKKVDGSFSMSKGGEQDMRSVYYAITIAKLTNVYSKSLFFNTPDWILSCRSYDGAFGVTPGAESHGEFTFYAVASLSLLNQINLCKADRVLKWFVRKQMRFEGGFQERTFTLADGSNSYWHGAIFTIIQRSLGQRDNVDGFDSVLYNQIVLQEYILLMCQNVDGGLVASPGRATDIYQTCYNLSGLSVAQHGLDQDPLVVGDDDNELYPLHPVHNIGPHHVYNAIHYFIRHPVPVQDF